MWWTCQSSHAVKAETFSGEIKPPAVFCFQKQQYKSIKLVLKKQEEWLLKWAYATLFLNNNTQVSWNWTMLKDVCSSKTHIAECVSWYPKFNTEGYNRNTIGVQGDI